MPGLKASFLAVSSSKALWLARPGPDRKGGFVGTELASSASYLRVMGPNLGKALYPLGVLYGTTAWSPISNQQIGDGDGGGESPIPDKSGTGTAPGASPPPGKSGTDAPSPSPDKSGTGTGTGTGVSAPSVVGTRSRLVK